MRGDGLVLPVAARSAPPTSIRHGFLFFVAVFGARQPVASATLAAGAGNVFVNAY